MSYYNMHMNHSMPMNHSMNMLTEPTVIGDTLSSPTFYSKNHWHKDQNLTAAEITEIERKPVDADINMELFGGRDGSLHLVHQWRTRI